MHAEAGSTAKRFRVLKAGVAIILFWTLTSIVSPAQSFLFRSLASFNGTNGSLPAYGPLVQGADGSFYGTTFQGGIANSGTIFKVTPSGELTSLHSFCLQAGCGDGGYPYAGLVLGSDGDFYGTTVEGGPYNNGTVFKITPSGALTYLHAFGGIPDGAGPAAGLVEGADGNFYGTTEAGGTGNYGTVFKITSAGETSILYSFSGGVDGALPFNALVLGRDGSFYGTTIQGGISSGNCRDNRGCGTIFKITPTGTLTTLHRFCSEYGCADGLLPMAALLQASDGNFYGTTEAGGIGWGNVFRITPAGILTSLYSFCPQFTCEDGEQPSGALIQGNDGNFYGTADIGGAYNYGTIFEITALGVLTTLHNFDRNDGGGPWAGLAKGRDGFFYGTTVDGGVWNDGTIFRIGQVKKCLTCLP